MAMENIVPTASLQQEIGGALTEVKIQEFPDLFGIPVTSTSEIVRDWGLPIEKGKMGKMTGNVMFIRFSPEEKPQVYYQIKFLDFEEEIAWAREEEFTVFRYPR